MVEKAMGEPELAIGDRLTELEERFRGWRESRRRGDRIPPQLWAAAVDMAREHGVPRVANRLRLNAEFLNRRMDGAVSRELASKADKPDTEFVELFAAPPPSTTTAAVTRECVIELENARGVKMRVELNGAGLAGLAHLCSGFWGAP
jgi:hypothetical protein